MRSVWKESMKKGVPTHCAGCYAACGMRAKVIDGVMVKAEGVPNSDFGARGGLCRGKINIHMAVAKRI